MSLVSVLTLARYVCADRSVSDDDGVIKYAMVPVYRAGRY